MISEYICSTLFKEKVRQQIGYIYSSPNLQNIRSGYKDLFFWPEHFVNKF